MLLPLAASSQEEAFYIEFKDESVVEAFTEIEYIYNVLFSELLSSFITDNT